MKYFPLVWAALRRKPVRTIITFLSVMVAFTLFGLMLGINATLDIMVEKARADRIWTLQRFENPLGMPVTIAKRIAQMPEVKRLSVMSFAGGYVGDPKNGFSIIFLDDMYGNIFPDQIPPPASAVLRRDRDAIVLTRPAAERLKKKVGDRLTLISETVRQDGSKNWTFTVGYIWDPTPQFPGDIAAAAYEVFDNALPPANRGRMSEVDIEVNDPAQAPAIAERIDRMFANSPTPTNSQTEKMIYSRGDEGLANQAMARKIAVIGLLMILFLTANVIANSVRERFVEFAALRTMGFRPGMLAALVIMEAAAPCLLGAAAGIGLAALLGPLIPSLIPPARFVPAPTIAPSVMLWALAGALAMAVLSAAWPVLRLSRLDVAAVLSGRT